jgi:hypothetical protein
MLRSVQASCAVVVATGVSATPAPADVLFDNFGSGDSYVVDTGWSVAWGVDFGVDLDQAAVFDVTGGDYFLDTIEIAIGHLFGPNLLFIDLHTDDAGVPGAVIDSTTISDVHPFGMFNPPLAADFGGDVMLEEGESYWVAISTVNDHAWFAWNYNVTGDLGLRADREDLGPWDPTSGDPRGAFRVNATPVPAAPTLAALAMASMFGRRRRR